MRVGCLTCMQAGEVVVVGIQHSRNFGRDGTVASGSVTSAGLQGSRRTAQGHLHLDLHLHHVSSIADYVTQMYDLLKSLTEMYFFHPWLAKSYYISNAV